MHVDPETGWRAGDSRPGHDASPPHPDWRVAPEIHAPYAQGASGDAVTLRPGDAFPGLSAGMRMHTDATIQVRVRALQGAELGLLDAPGGDPAALERIKTQAMSRKAIEDRHWFGLDAVWARDPQHNPYYASPAHVAWSEAMRLRCDGRLDAQWLRDFDPYGGALGQGALLFPGGDYPHALSKLAFAHRADWDLGRFFDAGPLRGLYDSSVPQPQLGFYGLSALCPVEPRLERLYGVGGHPDWDIDYLAHARVREDAAPSAVSAPESASISIPEPIPEPIPTPMPTTIAMPPSVTSEATAGACTDPTHALAASIPHAQRFDELLRDLAASGLAPAHRADCAAALLEAMVAARLDLDRSVAAVLGTRGHVIATLSEGEAAARVAVDIASAEGAFARWTQLTPHSEAPAPASPPLAVADIDTRPSPPTPAIG